MLKFFIYLTISLSIVVFLYQSLKQIEPIRSKNEIFIVKEIVYEDSLKSKYVVFNNVFNEQVFYFWSNRGDFKTGDTIYFEIFKNVEPIIVKKDSVKVEKKDSIKIIKKIEPKIIKKDSIKVKTDTTNINI